MTTSISDEAHQKFVQKWLEKKWINKRNCEVCNCDQWAVADFLVEFNEYDLLNVKDEIALHPMVLLMCTNCANTKTFNAIIMGMPGLTTKFIIY